MKRGREGDTRKQPWRSPRLPSETGLGVGPAGRDTTEEPPDDAAVRALQRFRSMMDRAGEAILIIDSRSRQFVDANETALKWLRLGRDQLLSLTVDDVDVEFPLQLPEESGVHLAETRDSDRPWRSSTGVHRRQDGTTFPVDVEISSHQQGDRCYLLVVARESRHRRMLEEELRQAEDKYRALCDLSSDAIYLTSRDGLVVAANHMAGAVFSRGSGLVGFPARQFYRDPADIKRFQREVAERGFARNLRIEFCRGDGTPFVGWLNVTLRRAGDGSVLGYLCMVRPATESPVEFPSDGGGKELTSGQYETVPATPVTSLPEDVPSGSSESAVLVRDRPSPRLPVRQQQRSNTASRQQRLWPAVLVLGVAFSVVAWLEFVTVEYPYQSGESAWVWLCRCLAGGLLLVGIMGRQRVDVARAVAVCCIVVAIGLVALCIAYISQLPFDLAAVVPGAAAEVRESILTAAAFTVGYSACLAAIGWYILRFSTGARPALLV